MDSLPRTPLVREIALALALAGLVVVGAPACNRQAEPETERGENTGTPLEPLSYEVPGTWTIVAEGKHGARKATYRIKGGDKEEAELEVFFFGTGKAGDPTPILAEWKKQFDGDVVEDKKTDAFTSAAGKVDWIELSGTYKQGLSPPVGPKKKSPVQMVKKNFRLLGAVVHTKDRGNWFFKLKGPEDTVQSVKSGFRTMLETAK